MANNKWNGALLGGAFGGISLLAIKGMQTTVGEGNFANTIYGWFASWGTSIFNKVVASAPSMNFITPIMYSFLIAIGIGVLIGLYTEFK
jgi:hypothetical protein